MSADGSRDGPVARPSGGERVARALHAHGVTHVFTLCGGHVAPVLAGAKHLGIAIVDVRHEADAVFAADAHARLTGVPGVAVVTAGPGVSNSLTALKRFVAHGDGVTLIGEFAAYRELVAEELAIVPIDHPLLQGAKARLLVKSGRPLAAAANELLEWILRRMSMFAPGNTSTDA